MPVKHKRLRLILDTNLWISFLISNRLPALDMLLNQHRLQLIFSEALLTEFLEVIQRPKFKKIFTPEKIRQLLKFIHVYGKLVPVKSCLELCRDPKDNFLLSLAKDAKAHFLITGDEDLLILEHVGQTKIMKYVDFVQWLSTE